MGLSASSMGTMFIPPAQSITVNSNTITENSNTQLPLKAAQQDDVAQESGKVRISMAGLLMAGQTNKKTAGKFDDIENSGLPDEVQRILKLIREIKEKLAEEQTKLQQVMADTSLSEETRKMMVAQCQARISALSGTLSDANLMLTQVTKDLNLGKEDVATIAMLSMK